MKFSITFKDPDCEIEWSTRPPKADSSSLMETRAFLEKWVEFNEYITVDFDTEAGTATVREAEKE